MKCDFYWFPTSVVYQQENRQCFGERMSDVKLCTYWLQIRHRDKKKIIKKALKLQIFKVAKKLAEFELMTIKMIETRKSSSGERQIKRVITSIKKFQHKSYFKLRRRELKELLKKHKQFHRQVALQTPEPVRFSNWQSAIHQFGYWSDAFDSAVIFVSLWRDWWPSFLILR